MKFITSCFFLWASITVSVAQTTLVQPIDGNDCSNLFFKALLEKDVQNVANLISNDFTLAGFQGKTINGAFLQQALSQNLITIESGMLTGANTRNYGDVAVITGQWNVSAKLENGSYRGDLSYMTVCVRSGGKWKVVALQVTPNQ